MFSSVTSSLIAGFFISGGLSYHTPHADCLSYSHGASSFYRYDENSINNPYGVVAIGSDFIESKHFTMSIEARHESSIAARDFGVNSLQLSAKWSPFK